MPTISVIVPVYKVEPYLRRCVDSILAQTFTHFELILVDDGSPDNCPAICDEYAAKDSRVRVIHQENGGLSAARNAGIDWAFANSDSQWITFIDSDDVVYPQYLELLLDAAVRNNADVSVCGLISFSDELSERIEYNFEGEKVLTPQGACLALYTNPKERAIYVSACTKLYRKRLFSSIYFPVGRIHEDQFTTYKLLYTAEYLVEIGARLYGYYENSSSISRSAFSLKRYDDLVACTEAVAFFADNGENELRTAASRKKRMLTAQYSIAARYQGISKLVPKEYQMTFLVAVRTLREISGSDYCEYVLGQYYPRSVKVCSYLKRIMQIIRRKMS